jgi:hypothetical protein
VLGLLDAVDERLEEAFVTYAQLGPEHPSLRDAAAAARFMGCDSAILAILDNEGDAAVDVLGGTHPALPSVVFHVARNPESVAGAYELALAANRQAACA